MWYIAVGRPLLLEDRVDRLCQFPGRDLAEPAVGEAEPFAAIRFPAQCPPCRLVLGAPDPAKALPGRGEALRDVTPAVGGMDQHEPEPWVAGVQGDRAGDPVRVVIRVRDDERQAQPTTHIPTPHPAMVGRSPSATVADPGARR
jgi:hypothetical protein